MNLPYNSYPDSRLLAIYQKGSAAVTDYNPFMAMPDFYNRASGAALEHVFKNGLGGEFELDTAHYYGFQRITAFDQANVGALTFQKASTRTIKGRTAENQLMAQIELSTTDIGRDYDQNGSWFMAKMRNLNDGMAQDLNTQMYGYTMSKFLSSNMIYVNWYDDVRKILVPHNSPFATYKAANLNILPSGNFTIMSLTSLLSKIRKATGDGLVGQTTPYFSIINQSTFEALCAINAVTFTEALTMEAYRQVMDDSVRLVNGKHWFSMTAKDVLDNAWLASNPNWLIPHNIPITGIPATNPVFTLTSILINNATGVMTGVITCPDATDTSVLGAGDVFGINLQPYKFLKAGNTDGTEGYPMVLTLDFPTGYNLDDKTTWLYHVSAPGAKTFNVNFVNTLRPLVSILGIKTPVGNDPNVDITVDFPSLPVTIAQQNAQVATKLAGVQLIPRVDGVEHALYIQPVANYQLVVPHLDMVQPLMANQMLGNRASKNFLEYASFGGNPDVIRGIEFPMSYQIIYDAPYFTFTAMRVWSGHTAIFDNYTHRTGAVSLYKYKN